MKEVNDRDPSMEKTTNPAKIEVALLHTAIKMASRWQLLLKLL